jgi:hypothetical protein
MASKGDFFLFPKVNETIKLPGSAGDSKFHAPYGDSHEIRLRDDTSTLRATFGCAKTGCADGLAGSGLDRSDREGNHGS